MAAVEIYTNQATTTVSSGGTDAPAPGTSQSWTVASSTAFPAAATGVSQFHICDTASGKTSEIIAVTNVSGTTWTVTRGAESTTPVAHTAGFTIIQVVTAGGLGSLLASANNLSDVASETTAFGNISPMTTLGDIIYENSAPAGTRLAGNTSATKKFLTQTGTGSSSAAPAWGTIATVDVPTLNQNTSGTASNITDTLDQVPAPAANVSMNSHKITSLAAGAAATDAVNIGQTVQVVNVLESGADPTGGTDSTTAIGNAVSAAASAGVPVFFPAGTYKITAALNWKINGLVVIGDGSGTTTISQATANTPILQVAGSYQNISGLTLTWPSQQTSGQTSAIGIEFGDDSVGSCFQSWFHDIQILKSNTGLAINPAIVTVAGMFSCLLQDIAIGFYSFSAINLIGGNGVGANCTGCVFTNIYTQNNSNAAANYAVYLQNWDEVTFHQLNIEHVTCSTFDALALITVGNAVIAGLHFEELTLSADQKALVYMSHPGKATIYGMTCRFSTFSGATLNSVYRFNDTGCSLIADGLLLDSSNTVSTPAFYMVNYNSATSVTVYLRSADTTGTTATATGAGTGSILAQLNGTSLRTAANVLDDGSGNATIGGNTKLAAGSTSLAPLTFQSGTNLTTATAGVMEYDGTAFYATAAASSRQVNDTEQFICQSSPYTLAGTTTAQALFNATANGALTIQALTTYFFECNAYVTGLSSSSHTISFGFGGGASYTSVLWNSYVGLSAAGNTTSATGTAATATAITAATSGTVLQAQIRGALRVNSGGSVIPQITQNTAAAAGVVQPDSYFRIWPAGGSAVTHVGNWS